MRRPGFAAHIVLGLFFLSTPFCLAADRVPVHAAGIPLADHYAGIIAYEKYRDQMRKAEFSLKLLPGPGHVRAYFFSKPEADMAFNVCPMVMDMFRKKPIFKWISLIHRDGNAFAVNQHFFNQVDLPGDKRSRLPVKQFADAIKTYREKYKEPVRIGVPSLLATHTTILYTYLKQYDLSFGFKSREDVDVILDIVAPPKSPVYLKRQDARGRLAAFEQSMPWPEVAEIERTGHISWYSRDMMHHEKGHVECIIIAKTKAIREKTAALAEVVRYIHLAGMDIESARIKQGKAMEDIVAMIRRHIPGHSRRSITQTLRSDLNIINFAHLNVDENAIAGMRHIMEKACEAGFLKEKIDIERMADDRFNTTITDQGEKE